MNHEVAWNKEIIDIFIREGNLNQEQIRLMQLRTTDHTDYEIASELNISVATYYRRVEKLKRIYDKVASENNNLPKRDLLNSKLFAFKNKDNAMEFVKNLTFEDGIMLEMKIIKTKKGSN